MLLLERRFLHMHVHFFVDPPLPLRLLEPNLVNVVNVRISRVLASNPGLIGGLEYILPLLDLLSVLL